MQPTHAKRGIEALEAQFAAIKEEIGEGKATMLPDVLGQFHNFKWMFGSTKQAELAQMVVGRHRMLNKKPFTHKVNIVTQ